MNDLEEQQWLEWRKQGVTATDIAKAVSGSYGGLYAVVASKLGLYEQEYNAAMNRGHRWEPVLQQLASVATGKHVILSQAQIEHPENHLFRATIDGVLSDTPEYDPHNLTTGIEIKTRGKHVKPDWGYWEPQMQWQMLVTGLDSWVLAEAVIDDDVDELVSFKMHTFTADPFQQEALLDKANIILRHIKDQTLPEPDSAECLEVTKKIFRQVANEPEVIDLKNIDDDVNRYAQLGVEIAKLENDRDLIKAKLINLIGNHVKGEASKYVVTYSKPQSILTSEKKQELLKLYPDLGVTVLDMDKAKLLPDLNDFKQNAGSRSLTVKPRKEK